MVFVADDLAGWLIGLLADVGRKKLATLVLGSDQERALRQAATVAVQRTAAQLVSSDGEHAEQSAMVISEVFREPVPDAAVAESATLLQALQAGITARLAVLDDASLTGTGKSSAEVLGVSGGVLAETLANHLVREIMLRGSGGGPLAPLADQLNHDVTHLQGQRLEGILAQLADQVKALAQPGSTAATPAKPVRLLPRPTSLAGREDLLADLDTRLTIGDGPGPRIVALYGLGGAGKTSVAVEYAHRHLDEVGVAWQLPAGDPTLLAAGFGELAAQLGARLGAEGGDPVTSVHAVLAAYPAGWLLVFDNSPGPAAVQQFLPPAGEGRILITSRNALWPPRQAVEVPVLGLDVAAGFLIERTNDLHRQAARELAGELGGLPLALEQAAAYTQATGRTLASYLALFRQRRSDLLARGEPSEYSGTVATTWALAFARLEQSAPEAVGLLRLLAFCAPEAVPLRLLLQPQPRITGELSPQVTQVLVPLLEDELAAGDAIAALREYSLVRPAGDGAVSVHRLVQAVTADKLPDELRDAWQQAAAAVIEAALPDDPRQPGTWPVFATLLPHAQAALTADRAGMERIAAYLASSGTYVPARELYREVVNARIRDRGAEHPDTLDAQASLALSTANAGDEAGARDQLAALLPIMERVLGPGHPQTLAARDQLAGYTGEAGDAAGARDQLAALLPIRERVLGPEHEDTLGTRYRIAYWTGRVGDAARARDQLAALLPTFERVSGPEASWTLTTRGGLADYTGEAGDPAAARDQYAALLPILERVLGPEHPLTLDARAGLARWTGEAGDAAAACDQAAALLPIYERVLGPEHPVTLHTRRSLAAWTGEGGDDAGTGVH